MTSTEIIGIKQWFADYLKWMTTHQYGIDEREAKNNHGTCWVMQVAAFARLTGNRELINFSRDRFKTVLVPNQVAADGSFPLEMRRTKPYGYALFNLEAMTTICQLLSSPEDNLWTFELGAALLERRRISEKSGILPNLPIIEHGLRGRYRLHTISHYEEATLYGSLRCNSQSGSG